MAQSIQDRLLAAQIAIENALNDEEIAPLLTAYGYDVTKLNVGNALRQAAMQEVQRQVEEYGDQFTATDIVNQAWQQANAEYMKHVKIARVAFKNERGAFQKLALDGQRKRTLSGWLGQARQCYSNALSDTHVQNVLLGFGIDVAALTAAQALVDAAEQASAAQESEKGDAQQATLERNKAMQALDAWMSDFIAIARIALAGKPQLLEKLGVQVKN